MSDVAIIALAGGTGSGKSSLFNALLESDLAMVGPLRPTTEYPLLAIPRRDLDSLQELIGSAMSELVSQSMMPSVCLIDLPDTDSVVVDHSEQVEELLSGVDLVVWVVDPEKYRDAALHDRFLRPRAEEAHRFVFVLNHIDRVDPMELETVTADLRQALEEDGIAAPEILVTAADPPLGPPIGVDVLRVALERRARALIEERELISLTSETWG